MACPFFMPTAKFEDGAWRHRPRLPLGDGWRGHCTAPGHEGVHPSDEELKEFCNLGYARGCQRLPQRRHADAVRFSPGRDAEGKVQLFYVCEVDHGPGEHGTLEYDSVLGRWNSAHPDTRIQKMADCYLDAYLLRKQKPVGPGRPST